MNPVIQAFKEMSQYLGAKLDTLAAAQRAPIKVDVGESSKSLASAATAVEKAARTLDALGKSNDTSGVHKGLISLAASVGAMAKAVGTVKPTDMSKTNRLLEQVARQVGGLKLEVPETDLSRLDDVVLALAQVREAVNAKPLAEDRTDEIIAAVKGLKIQLPDSMKIDASQLAQIRLGGGGGATASYAQTVVTANVDMDDADTQYSYQFPANTIGFRIRVRDNAIPLLYAWATGTLPTSGDGSAYSTLQAYSELVRDSLDVGGKTIYLQTGSASQVAEIEVFKLQ